MGVGGRGVVGSASEEKEGLRQELSLAQEEEEFSIRRENFRLN